MERYSAIDNSVTDRFFQHISNVITSRRREPVGGPHIIVDCLPLRCSMGGDLYLPLPDPHSLLRVNPCRYLVRYPVAKPIAMVLYFRSSFWNPGLLCQMSSIFSRNSSKGERSEMLLSDRSSHFKSVNLAIGDISDMSLRLRLR